MACFAGCSVASFVAFFVAFSVAFSVTFFAACFVPWSVPCTVAYTVACTVACSVACCVSSASSSSVLLVSISSRFLLVVRTVPAAPILDSRSFCSNLALVKRLSIQTTWPCPLFFIRSRRVRTTACVAQKPSFSIADQDSGAHLACCYHAHARGNQGYIHSQLIPNILNPVGVGLLGMVTISEALPWKPWIASSTARCVPGFQKRWKQVWRWLERDSILSKGRNLE
jgi:hypothetical protein